MSRGDSFRSSWWELSRSTLGFQIHSSLIQSYLCSSVCNLPQLELLSGFTSIWLKWKKNHSSPFVYLAEIPGVDRLHHNLQLLSGFWKMTLPKHFMFCNNIVSKEQMHCQYQHEEGLFFANWGCRWALNFSFFNALFPLIQFYLILV